MLLTLTSVAMAMAALCSVQAVAADDAAMMAAMQQQAATITRMEAKLTALDNEVTIIRERNDNLTQTVHSLDTRSGVQVAFTAHMAGTHVFVGDVPFVFPIVGLNAGDGYNGSSGIFTAPATGLYVFHFLVVNDASAPFIQVALFLQRGGSGPTSTLGVGTVDGGANDSYDDGSALVTSRLNKGDRVWLQRNAGANRVYGDVFCTFTGFSL